MLVIVRDDAVPLACCKRAQIDLFRLKPRFCVKSIDLKLGNSWVLSQTKIYEIYICIKKFKLISSLNANDVKVMADFDLNIFQWIFIYTVNMIQNVENKFFHSVKKKPKIIRRQNYFIVKFNKKTHKCTCTRGYQKVRRLMQ